MKTLEHGIFTYKEVLVLLTEAEFPLYVFFLRDYN